MKRFLCSLLAVIFISFSFAVVAETNNTPLTLDPDVRTGKLENGMTYFIKKNKKPDNRMELRLAVNAGSVLEDDDQQGLAHFCEHMAFNGSKHFEKNELVNYLESIGVRFGADLNAYTSFDETVYMLQLPTDTPSIVDKGFTVLEDWAHYVSYDSVEIDKERGVVIEEWRIGRGADARMEDKQFPILFQGSKYADRLPIGKKPILESFKHDVLKRFYNDWYRPELMCVVAVGDFDVDQIENEIKQHFNEIPKSTAGRERITVAVPDVDETRYAIATDPEASESSVGLMYKQPLKTIATVNDFRARLIQSLYNTMFNGRLNELAQLADAPFTRAFGNSGRFVRNGEFYSLDATVKNGGIQRGLEALLTEAARVKKFGFTATELERTKRIMLRGMDQRYDERDKTDSRVVVNQLVAYFLRNEPFMSIEKNRDMYHELMPTITLDEVNALATTLMPEKNRIVSVNAPQKPDVKVPTKDELSSIIFAAQGKDITAYVDRVINKPLVDRSPRPMPPTSEKFISELGVTEWTFANGVKVILKPTDFKNDEILMSAYRPGGTSVAPDAKFISADEAADIIDESGVGSFDQTALRKTLAGKIANVSPHFSETHDLLSGSASPKDLQTMLELTYLYFTAPRKDSTEFQSYIAKMRTELQNRSAEPLAVFQDSLIATLYLHHPRRSPTTDATINQIDLNTAFDFYRSRFADANGFTFVFVGNFDPNALKPMVGAYIGNLPATQQKSMWKDVGIHTPHGVVEKIIKKGIEPKSQVRIIFSGPFKFSPENRWKLQAMCNVLSIKMREQLREEKGGVYGVSAYGSPMHQPRDEYQLTVSFPCAPERVDELVKQAMLIIDSVQKFGAAPTYISKIKELQLRERETAIKQNRFWLSALQQYYMTDEDPRVLLKYNAMVNTLTSDMVRDAARTYCNMKNYVKVELVPEK